MGFQPIASAPGRHREDVTVSIKRAVGHLPRLRVSVHAEVARSLNWTKDIRLEPMVGEGPDRGMIKIRVAANPKTGFKLAAAPGHQNTSRLYVVFQAPAGSPEKHLLQSAEYALNAVERSITIRLPWAVRAQLRAAE